jgi:chromosome partitioning protein
LSYDTDELLTVDTCPQGNLSYFYDASYYQSSATSANDLLLPYFIPGLGHASRVAKLISATNMNFANKSSYFVPSSSELYMMPSQMANALVQAKTIAGANQTLVIDNMLYSLKTEIKREMQETNAKRCLIDTSPFFSGATHLAWHACDALIIPVRTDQQSINSLSLLIDTLSNPASEFRRNMPSDGHTPKIQMIVLTHCGWSTVAGSRNKPNQQTKIFLEKVRDIVNRNITHFTTQNPDNHIMLLDDFLGCGRISSAESKPIFLLYPGYSKTINRVKTTVNPSVTKIQGQLKFISSCIW